MKTIKVQDAQVVVDNQVIGTVKTIGLLGSIPLFSTEASVFASLLDADNKRIVGRNVIINSGISSAGADWAVIEADILTQLDLIKSENQ
jgi:hypothetical protein